MSGAGGAHHGGVGAEEGSGGKHVVTQGSAREGVREGVATSVIAVPRTRPSQARGGE